MARQVTSKSKPARRSQWSSDLGFTWGVPNRVLLGAGVAAIVWGYVALSKGSITLAPLLLAVGYCVLIPASLLIRSGEEASGE